LAGRARVAFVAVNITALVVTYAASGVSAVVFPFAKGAFAVTWDICLTFFAVITIVAINIAAVYIPAAVALTVNTRVFGITSCAGVAVLAGYIRTSRKGHGDIKYIAKPQNISIAYNIVAYANIPCDNGPYKSRAGRNLKAADRIRRCYFAAADSIPNLISIISHRRACAAFFKCHGMHGSAGTGHFHSSKIKHKGIAGSVHRSRNIRVTI